MKQLLALSLLIIFASCKKKESAAPNTTNSQTTTGTTQSATYECNLVTGLTLTQNISGFDTSFLYWGKYSKTVGTTVSWLYFPSTNFNGYLSNVSNSYNGNILSCPSYIQLANSATWNVVSTEFGNFQYVDTIPLPRIVTTSSTVPITFDAAQGIPLNITGIQNADAISIDDIDDLYFPGYSIKYYQNFGTNSSVQDTIRAIELYDIPVNTTFTMSVICGKMTYATINNHTSYVRRYTTYNYNVKRIN